MSARRSRFFSGGVIVYLAALYLYLSVFVGTNSAALGQAYILLSDGGVLVYLSAIKLKARGSGRRGCVQIKAAAIVGGFVLVYNSAVYRNAGIVAHKDSAARAAGRVFANLRALAYDQAASVYHAYSAAAAAYAKAARAVVSLHGRSGLKDKAGAVHKNSSALVAGVAAVVVVHYRLVRGLSYKSALAKGHFGAGGHAYSSAARA